MSDKITIISAIIAVVLYFIISRLLSERVKAIVMIVLCGICCGWCFYPIVAMGATDPKLKLGTFLCAIGVISWILVLVKNIKGGKHASDEN